VPGEVVVHFIALMRRIDSRQRHVRRGRVGSGHLKGRLDPAAWVLSREINAMDNCAGCNERLATVPGEIGVQFIALLRRFDRTQGPVWEKKSGLVT
jgi:hypothetical protein